MLVFWTVLLLAVLIYFGLEQQRFSYSCGDDFTMVILMNDMFKDVKSS